MQKQILEKLSKIESLFSQIQTKEILNFCEACEYLNLSASYLYKCTHKQLIPFYKPGGKKIYFKRSELEAWLLRNKVKTADEIEQAAIDYVAIKKRK